MRILLNVKMQHSFVLGLIQFESFLIEYLAAMAFLHSAVALGGRMGVVPDNAASGTITEPAPDCSLPPSSSLLLATFYYSLYTCCIQMPACPLPHVDPCLSVTE